MSLLRRRMMMQKKSPQHPELAHNNIGDVVLTIRAWNKIRNYIKETDGWTLAAFAKIGNWAQPVFVVDNLDNYKISVSDKTNTYTKQQYYKEISFNNKTYYVYCDMGFEQPHVNQYPDEIYLLNWSYTYPDTVEGKKQAGIDLLNYYYYGVI